jgi:hypothetical protein
MTIFHIKLIAILAMVVDHVGLFFYPQLIIFRIIGRLSFPLFAWLISNGAYHTKNMNHYLKRILILGLISQIPFTFANNLINLSGWSLNIFFTLFLGLLAISFIRKTSNIYIQLFITIVLSLVASFLNTDYGFFGVLSIILFYVFFKNKKYILLSQFLISILPLLLSSWKLMSFPYLYYLAPLGLFSLIFIFSYNNKEGQKMKYLFYSFYPLHYFLIYLFKLAFH